MGRDENARAEFSSTVSARTLGYLRLCPRCGWIRLRCRELPFGRMPGIFNSIDAYVKQCIRGYFDQHGILPVWLPHLGEIRRYVPGDDLHYSRFSIVDPDTRIRLNGSPDDVFRLGDGSYHIVDYKTARFTETQDALLPLYEVQLNAYAYIARKRGWVISGLSLIYLEPQTAIDPVSGNSLLSDRLTVDFQAVRQPVTLCDDTLIPPLFQQTRELLEQQKPPQGTDGCEDCHLLDQLIAQLGLVR